MFIEKVYSEGKRPPLFSSAGFMYLCSLSEILNPFVLEIYLEEVDER
jgi:hypothetical protein